MTPPEAQVRETARAIVAKWEHGDQAHREWLRSVAVPDIIAALAAARAEERERWMACATYIHTPDGPKYRGWNVSALSRIRLEIEAEAAIRSRAESETGEEMK